jgi:hypothetical protein
VNSTGTTTRAEPLLSHDRICARRRARRGRQSHRLVASRQQQLARRIGTDRPDHLPPGRQRGTRDRVGIVIGGEQRSERIGGHQIVPAWRNAAIRSAE